MSSATPPASVEIAKITLKLEYYCLTTKVFSDFSVYAETEKYEYDDCLCVDYQEDADEYTDDDFDDGEDDTKSCDESDCQCDSCHLTPVHYTIPNTAASLLKNLLKPGAPIRNVEEDEIVRSVGELETRIAIILLQGTSGTSAWKWDGDAGVATVNLSLNVAPELRNELLEEISTEDLIEARDSVGHGSFFTIGEDEFSWEAGIDFLLRQYRWAAVAVVLVSDPGLTYVKELEERLAKDKHLLQQACSDLVYLELGLVQPRVSLWSSLPGVVRSILQSYGPQNTNLLPSVQRKVGELTEHLVVRLLSDKPGFKSEVRSTYIEALRDATAETLAQFTALKDALKTGQVKAGDEYHAKLLRIRALTGWGA